MHDFNLRAPVGANKKKKILGRGQGCGKGTTSGKGHKGQKARSGGKTYVGFEGGQMPLYRRLAHRGFSNYPFKQEWQIVNLGEIENRYEAGETVDAVSLLKKGILKGNDPIKVLSDGNFTKKLNFKVDAVSAGAKAKIEKVGGTVEVNAAFVQKSKAKPAKLAEPAEKKEGKE